MRARVPSDDTQTPPLVAGAGVRSSRSMMCSISPVGSFGSSDLSKSPAGDARSSIVSSMAACRPAAEKRAAATSSLKR
jgi:hypothetical protein